MTTLTIPAVAVGGAPPTPPTVPLLALTAPDLATQADAAWRATQVNPAMVAGDLADPTHACQALRLLLEHLLQQAVPLPAVPYVQAGPCLFSICWTEGPTGAEYALSLVQPCGTPGCCAVAFSAPIRSLADLGAARRPGAAPRCPACAAAAAHGL